MPKQPFFLTLTISTSVTAVWNFKCANKISYDKGSETLCWVCCSGPLQSTGWFRLLEQLEQISLCSCERYQRYVCFQSVLWCSVRFQTQMWHCSFKTVILQLPYKALSFGELLLKIQPGGRKMLPSCGRWEHLDFGLSLWKMHDPKALVELMKMIMISTCLPALRGNLGWSLFTGLGLQHACRLLLPISANRVLWAECATES